MAYVDGFVIPVPADKRDAYAEMAARVAQIWLDHGAIRVVECWGDEVRDGKVTDFRRAVQAGEGENVVFSWVEWPSRQARDEGNAKVMADPRMEHSHPHAEPMFDGKRLIFGGFDAVYDSAE